LPPQAKPAEWSRGRLDRRRPRCGRSSFLCLPCCALDGGRRGSPAARSHFPQAQAGLPASLAGKFNNPELGLDVPRCFAPAARVPGVPEPAARAPTRLSQPNPLGHWTKASRAASSPSKSLARTLYFFMRDNGLSRIGWDKVSLIGQRHGAPALLYYYCVPQGSALRTTINYRMYSRLSTIDYRPLQSHYRRSS
jgi:hypothetical protein